MSLAFVSSAVLSSTDGVSHNEETAVDSKEVQDVRSRQAGGQQPLFQQLQANKNKEEEEREEFQRNIMRGTMTLDDEDCAHLEAIQRQKDEQQQSIRKDMEDELALFRAAKADRSQSQLIVEDEDESEEKKHHSTVAPKRQAVAPLLPNVIIKHKRRRQHEEQFEASAGKQISPNKASGSEAPSPEDEIKSKGTDIINTVGGSEQAPSGLSLLGGYGSSDSDIE